MRLYPMCLTGQAAQDRILWCFIREIKYVHGFGNDLYHRSSHDRMCKRAAPYYCCRQAMLLRRRFPCQRLEVRLVFGLWPNRCPVTGDCAAEVYGEGQVEGDMFNIERQKAENLQSTCSVPSSVLLAGKSLLNTWTTSSSSLAQFATNNELGEEEDMWEWKDCEILRLRNHQ